MTTFAPSQERLSRALEALGPDVRLNPGATDDPRLSSFPETARALRAWKEVRCELQALRPDSGASYTDAEGRSCRLPLSSALTARMLGYAEAEGDAKVARELEAYVAEIRAALSAETAKAAVERKEQEAEEAWEGQAYVYPYPPPRACGRWSGRLVWLYHGTTTTRLKAILREGIRPDLPARRRAETKPGRTFLTANAGGGLRSGQAPGAGMYAQRASELWGGDPLVLRVIVPWAVLTPDSDDADLACAGYQWETDTAIQPEQIMEANGRHLRGPISATEPWRLGHSGPRPTRRPGSRRTGG